MSELEKLNKTWGEYKKETKATQASMAKKLKITPAAFGQYLNGKIPLNTDFILEFSTAIGVKPWAIRTSLKKHFKEQ